MCSKRKTHSTIALNLYVLGRPAVEMSDNRRPGSVTAKDLSTNPLGLPVSRLSVQDRLYIQAPQCTRSAQHIARQMDAE